MIEVIKLVTGEEIVGDTKYEQNKVIVKKPCAVMLVNSKSAATVSDSSQTAITITPRCRTSAM